MKLSYNSAPDFAFEKITITVELEPSEVGAVLTRLIRPGAASFLPQELKPDQLADAHANGVAATLDRLSSLSTGTEWVMNWLRECRMLGMSAPWPVLQRSNLDRVLLLGMPIGMTDVSSLDDEDARTLRRVLTEELQQRNVSADKAKRQ